MRVRRRERSLWSLAAIVGAGAAVRFATLGVQSFWLDEAVTHQLVTRSLGAMLRAIPSSESTPPLYYVLAWLWVRIFGAGEFGLRSLSALFGTATIVVLAAIARRLSGERAALAAAALAAASPLLIWYSQEARAYALLVLLCAITVWCLLREDWLGWGIAAVLALATHYFAVFIVVPELVWVVGKRARRRGAPAIAALGVVVVGAALLPLAIAQAGGNRAAFIRSTGLASRIAAVPKQFLIGYATPHATVLTVLAALLALGLALQLRARDGAMLGLAACAVGVPVLLALAGADYVITRNLIMAMVPLVVLAAVASTRSRAGPALVAGICAAGIVAFVGVERTPADQRDDWRAVARALGPFTGPHPPKLPLLNVGRAVVVDPASGELPLEVYAPLEGMPYIDAVFTRVVDVVELARDAPVPAAALPLAGFVATVEHTSEFTLVRYVAPAPVEVSYTQLAHLALVVGPPYPNVLVGA